jgi:hypothetical protein
MKCCGGTRLTAKGHDIYSWHRYFSFQYAHKSSFILGHNGLHISSLLTSKDDEIQYNRRDCHGANEYNQLPLHCLAAHQTERRESFKSFVLNKKGVLFHRYILKV